MWGTGAGAARSVWGIGWMHEPTAAAPVRHPSTPADRVPWGSRVLADEGTSGTVAAVARDSGVPRQPL